MVNPNAALYQTLIKTTGGVSTYHVYGLGLIAEETGADYKTYHYDFRGSTVALTDSTGLVTDNYSYAPYGELLSHTGTSDVDYLYNGRDGVVTDDNGLYQMRARYYSSELRRFLNEDEYAGKYDDILNINLYAYCEGNPVGFVDPSGQDGDETGEKDAYVDPGTVISAIQITPLGWMTMAAEINGAELPRNAYIDNALMAIALKDVGKNALKAGLKNTIKSGSKGILRSTDFGKVIEDSAGHVFSQDHIRGGIMELGKTPSEIMNSGLRVVEELNSQGLLKNGSTQIKTMINGCEAEIRIFIKDGNLINFNMFKDWSSRNMGNTIFHKP